MNTPPVLKAAKQKLVTIYVDNMAYAGGKMLVGSFADKHGKVEEHLETYLQQGWRIVSVHGFGPIPLPRLRGDGGRGIRAPNAQPTGAAPG